MSLRQAQAPNLGSRSTASTWRFGWRHEWTRWSPGCHPESGSTAAARQDLQRGEDTLFEKKHHRNCWFRRQRAATGAQKALCPCLCKLPWKATWLWPSAHTWEQNNQDWAKVWKYGYLYFFSSLKINSDTAGSLKKKKIQQSCTTFPPSQDAPGLEEFDKSGGDVVGPARARVISAKHNDPLTSAACMRHISALFVNGEQLELVAMKQR